MSWTWGPRATTLTVHAPDMPERKPVLYDAKGNPLAYPPPRLGFVPPKDRQTREPK